MPCSVADLLQHATEFILQHCAQLSILSSCSLLRFHTYALYWTTLSPVAATSECCTVQCIPKPPESTPTIRYVDGGLRHDEFTTFFSNQGIFVYQTAENIPSVVVEGRPGQQNRRLTCGDSNDQWWCTNCPWHSYKRILWWVTSEWVCVCITPLNLEQSFGVC